MSERVVRAAADKPESPCPEDCGYDKMITELDVLYVTT